MKYYIFGDNCHFEVTKHTQTFSRHIWKHQMQTTIVTSFQKSFRCTENIMNFCNMTNFCKLRTDDLYNFAPIKIAKISVVQNYWLKLLQPNTSHHRKVARYTNLIITPSSPSPRCTVFKAPRLRRLISTR